MRYADLTPQQILKGTHFHEPTFLPIHPDRLLGRTYCLVNALHSLNKSPTRFSVPVMSSEYKSGYIDETAYNRSLY